MLFTDYFGVVKDARDRWFDPILARDTELFIDPLLIRTVTDIPEFENSYSRLVGFYDAVLQQAAATTPSMKSAKFRRLVGSLQFPEVRELCLGYTRESSQGAGSSKKLARVFAEGVFESVDAGVVDGEHFEEVALLKANIGADRISDMAANILRVDIAAYTARVCDDYQIRTERYIHERATFDPTLFKWVPAELRLPLVEIDGQSRYVMLVPRIVLRVLPSIHWTDFRDFLLETDNQLLRDEFGVTVKQDVNRAMILDIARRFRTSKVAEYVARRSSRPRPAYDLLADPSRRYRLVTDAWDWWSDADPSHVAEKAPSVRAFVDFLIDEFASFMESSGWGLVWNRNGTPKNEEAAQTAFEAFARAASRMVDVDLTREAGTGRGPVDFKFSRGSQERVVLEVKLASEPPRECWRLQSLRGWSDDTTRSIPSRDARAGSAARARARRRVPVAVGSDHLDRDEVRDDAGDPAQVGPHDRGRFGSAVRAHHRRA